MPDRRRHRGPHPDDPKLFTNESVDGLRVAVEEYSWLLTRRYGETSALKLVGDRHQLTARQRDAVSRAACSDDAIKVRAQKRCTWPLSRPDTLLLIDGYNVLITVESALAGGVIFVGRDGCYRDLASLHGTYRTVEETVPAIEHIGALLHEAHTGDVRWYLDAPVSNSGRLADQIRSIAEANGWRWSADVVPDPDRVLATATDAVASTSDSVVLDACSQWIDLAKCVIDRLDCEVRRVDLRAGTAPPGAPAPSPHRT